MSGRERLARPACRFSAGAHIVYAGAYPGYGLRYATNQGGSWSLATIDSVYVTSLSGAWQVAIIDRNAGVPAALALDSQGKAHISYFGASLKYATNK